MDERCKDLHLEITNCENTHSHITNSISCIAVDYIRLSIQVGPSALLYPNEKEMLMAITKPISKRNPQISVRLLTIYESVCVSFQAYTSSPVVRSRPNKCSSINYIGECVCLLPSVHVVPCGPIRTRFGTHVQIHLERVVDQTQISPV